MHFTSYQPLNINVTLKKITFSDKAGTFNHWGNNILFIKWYWNTWPVICMTNYIIIQNQNKFQIDFRFCFFFSTVSSSKFLASYHPVSFAIHRYKQFRYKFTIAITYLPKLTMIPWDCVSQSLSDFPQLTKKCIFTADWFESYQRHTHCGFHVSWISLNLKNVFLFFSFFLLSCYLIVTGTKLVMLRNVPTFQR